jgi:glycosyltransferase involved in cell wall biosynthesis
MISVIIPVYNAEKYIDNLLHSLMNQDFPKNNFEIIIVNDGSTDNTCSQLLRWKKEIPNFNIISISNSGPGIARNKGVEIAKGEIIAFTDADCIPPLDWLKRIYEEFEKNPEICIVYGAVSSNIRGKLLPFFISFEIKGEYISPSNMAIKKEYFISLKGFDASFSYLAEDWEFTYRVKKKGVKIKFCENIKVYHPHRCQKIKLGIRDAKKWWETHLLLKESHPDYPLKSAMKPAVLKSFAIILLFLFSIFFFNSWILKIGFPLLLLWGYGLYRVIYVKYNLHKNFLKDHIKIKDMLMHIFFGWTKPFISLFAFLLALKKSR